MVNMPQRSLITLVTVSNFDLGRLGLVSACVLKMMVMELGVSSVNSMSQNVMGTLSIVSELQVCGQT